MIRPEDRLWAGGGRIFPNGPYTWYVTDLDQRRDFSVTYDPPEPTVSDEETEEICVQKLQKHLDDLGDDILGMSFSTPDGPITTSTSRKDDVTFYVNGHPLPALDLPFPIKTISASKLTELDRLGPQVDLVSCAEHDGSITTATFKYWFMDNGMFRTWYELLNWSRLPRDHPHIVPFDSVVLEPCNGTIIGFTTLFMPGGNLWDNGPKSRPFRLRWFQQLLSVVDDLNYRYGLMHQDIAPRNLVIDQHDNLRIFDFNYTAFIAKNYKADVDDIKGVVFTLYELITLDDQYRQVPPEDQDPEAVLQLEWKKHPDVKLDSEVADFRSLLQEWVHKRNSRTFEPQDTWMHWQPMPKPRDIHVPTCDTKAFEVTGTKVKNAVIVKWVDMQDLGQPFWNWERPASYRLRDALEQPQSGTASQGK